jgi:hypothetical protein
MDTKGSLQHQDSISLDLDKTITFSQNVEGEYVTNLQEVIEYVRLMNTQGP